MDGLSPIQTYLVSFFVVFEVRDVLESATGEAQLTATPKSTLVFQFSGFLMVLISLKTVCILLQLHLRLETPWRRG